MSSILYILLAIVVLLLMVMIHELGHYTAGKLLKFKINEFSVGFGKKLWQKTNKAGEKISLRLIPLGGYCAFEGEDEDGKDNPQAFNNQKPWKRLIVLFMGAFFNLLAGIIFSVIFLTFYGYADRIQVVSANRNPYGTAQEWFMEGDIITGVNGEKTSFVYDKYFRSMIVNFEDTEYFDVNIIRDGKKMVIKANVEYNELKYIVDGNGRKIFSTLSNPTQKDYIYTLTPTDDGKYVLNATNDVSVVYKSDQNGVFIIGDTRLKVTDDGNVFSIAQVGLTTKYYRYSFGEALLHAIPFTFGWAWKVLLILWGLICGKVSILGMTGPVGTITTIASATQASFANFFLLLPLISANLAVFNWLPIPALDGARMVFVLYEWIFRKPVNRKVEAYIHSIGMMILFAFVIVVDLLHIIL